MGKRILTQHRGKGGPQYRAPTKGKLFPAKYPFYRNTLSGEVEDIVHERGRDPPLTRVNFGGRIAYLPAVASLTAGSEIQMGEEASIKAGNVLPLSKIPEGTTICNIETRLGDGGRLVRSSGSSAILFTQTGTNAVVRLPSGKTTILKNNCRATIGQIAGSGRIEKPFLRAGARFHRFKARGKVYPKVRGIAMAAVHHPHGGGRHQHVGKQSSVARSTPPGRKVGIIAPRKTGRKRIAIAKQ